MAQALLSTPAYRRLNSALERRVARNWMTCSLAASPPAEIPSWCITGDRDYTDRGRFGDEGDRRGHFGGGSAWNNTFAS